MSTSRSPALEEELRRAETLRQGDELLARVAGEQAPNSGSLGAGAPEGSENTPGEEAGGTWPEEGAGYSAMPSEQDNGQSHMAGWGDTPYRTPQPMPPYGYGGRVSQLSFMKDDQSLEYMGPEGDAQCSVGDSGDDHPIGTQSDSDLPSRPRNHVTLRRTTGNERSLQSELQQLRDEITQLRIQNAQIQARADAYGEVLAAAEGKEAVEHPSEPPQEQGGPRRTARRQQSQRPAREGTQPPSPTTTFKRASSSLPQSSMLKKAMYGDPGDDGGSSSSDDDDEGKGSGGGGYGGGSRRGGSRKPESDSGGDVFDEEPESDHSSDSDGARRHKRELRRKHRAKLAKIRYQVNFLKEDPPFKYEGQLQASTFKKWVREVRNWVERGRLSETQGIKMSGKYLGGRAYHFFERDVLDLRKGYTTLTEYFEAMFDYLFPADFRMQQRDKFDACDQRDLSVQDYLRMLHGIADTIGDIEDRDIVMAFWRRCRSWLRIDLSRDGLDPSNLSLTALENAALRHERAHKIIEEERKKTKGAPNPKSPRPTQKQEQQSSPPRNFSNHSGNNTKASNSEKPSTGTQNNKFGGSGRSQKESERKRRLRAEGKCFECESKDHISKDCPKRNSKKPPMMALRSMGIGSAVETRLAAMDEGNKLGLFAASFKAAHATKDDPVDVVGESMGVSDAAEPVSDEELREVLRGRLLRTLTAAVPLALDYLGDDAMSSPYEEDRFELHDQGCVVEGGCGLGHLLLYDQHTDDEHELKYDDLLDPEFDAVQWLHKRKTEIFDELIFKRSDATWFGKPVHSESFETVGDSDGETIALGKIGISDQPDYQEPDSSRIERTALRVRKAGDLIPRPTIVMAKIAGQPCRALLDTGSMGDFVSTTLADQLRLDVEQLKSPLTLQLAISGSRGVIKHIAEVAFEYQGIQEKRTFFVANLDSHDIILGLPFMVQHSVVIGFNPSLVTVRNDEAGPIRCDQAYQLTANVMGLSEIEVTTLREELSEYAKSICKEAIETPLPPLRAINHVIPLIDESKVYSWRPSKCPEALKPLWRAKREDYVRTGRWEFRSGTNSVPMIMLRKPTKDGTIRLRTVLDTRQRNQNTRKLASPLPDIDTILRNVSSHKYRSLLDGKDAYEQIRVAPEDVHKTLFTTPDGTMISHVMQIGDCNAGATYQSLMNHIFAPYIGVFMDVYLDDIVVYSDTAADHVKHVKIVIDTLRENHFFLSEHKLQFFKDELNILGHVIDDQGIRMDPAKVDKVANWKVPTNKGLLASFIGAVGYLANGCEGIRIPMALLSKRASSTAVWKWTPTEQRAFDEVREIVQKWRDLRRVALNYGPSAPKVNLTCDASLTGGSGVLSQGDDPSTASIVAFWSGKFNAAQQNYPVHECELLAIVESLKRFRHLLQGVKFRIFTDHKGLEWLTTQKKLSPRQARWLEEIGDFDFEIVYIPGETNVVADALSRKENAPSKVLLSLVTSPLYTGDVVFLGAVTRAASEAREAFPNAKKVVLKLPERTEPLEGEMGENPENLPNDRRADESESEMILAEDPVTLPDIIALGDPRSDIHESIRNRYSEDSFFDLVLKDPKAYKNFEVGNGLVFMKTSGKRILCIPDVMIGDRRVREMLISHAHSILAHLGPSKTMTYLRDNVWWKGIMTNVQAFCDSCVVCKTSKPSNQAPYGKLQTLDVPSRPWETIGIDFVGPLPESENLNGKFDMLMVIIDHLTSMVHLTPTKQTYRAKDIAEVIFDRVYKHHGMPSHIVSDRDSLFTSTFWKVLNDLAGIELRMSSAFHPQTDGATERANRTITQMLRQCVVPHQRDWVSKLPAIEFAINSARSDTTGYAPFMLNYGRMPRSMVFETDAEYPGCEDQANSSCQSKATRGSVC
ncbi:hypothetical protein NP233_g12425 [Leucocoprinus birnbaumii]|uniref:RNA-directed DNA polymerase n=1 Tax=Leucocoprinus birnbaumii TaxID=56174 RepID=A0AAD5VGC5_9AGAR|nr:hypothetical protein NP233_g12425 [Leucocoprinus birnbaumii]